MTQEDHDLLIEISTEIKGFIKKVDTHIQDDKEQFERLSTRQDRTDKIIFGIGGAILTLQFILKWFT